MTRPDFDIVIVGARCSGAPLATFMARAGARVLVVDRDALPSDQVLSTHTIHPPGFQVLEELGVADDVLSAVPPSPRVRLVKGEARVEARFAEGRTECCPRRERLDGLLQAAAAEAGAELRDRTRVTEVLFEGERAAGVRIERDGAITTVTADVVVGADGRRSTVADQVGAEEYLGYDAPRAIYWAYWEAPPSWRSERYPFDLYLGQRDEQLRTIFQTDHDQLLIASAFPVRMAPAWRDRPLEALRESLAADPITASLVEGADPIGKVRGTIKERYFFRRAAGPGWALAGDAGHHKDFVIGDGITEALLQARSLAAAIEEGTDGALVRWWRARDVEALPLYFWGREEGLPERPGPLTEAVFHRIAARPDLAQRLADLPEHRTNPYEVLPPHPALRALAGCLVRGRVEALREFAAHGKRAAVFRRELEKRQRLLEQVTA